MTSLRETAGYVAMGAGLVWFLKVGLIAANGGTNTSEGIVAVAYLLGLAALLLGAGLGGWVVATGRAPWVGGLSAAGGVVFALVLTQVVDTAVKAAYEGTGWLRDEISILVVAALSLGFGAWLVWAPRRAADEPRRATEA